jgi:glutathione S-transferase
MDWINTQFYREYGYHFIYPQIFPNHKRPTDSGHQETIEWGRDQSKGWLKILNDHWIGPNNQYLCGNQITVADYLGIGFITLGELIRLDFSKYPNVQRWINNMKKLKSWPKVNEVFYGFKDMLKDKQFVTL